MSTFTSCTLLSGVPMVRRAMSSGSRLLHSGRRAAVAPLPSQRTPRPLSVCCANPKGGHNPKTDLHPFNISPVVLVHPVPASQDERWQLEEEVGKVKLQFEVPGQSKDDLAVEIDEDVLVIKKKTGSAGQSAGTTKEKPAEGDVIYARLLLPAGYSREGVAAELKSGVLMVTVTKIKDEARRKIDIPVK